MATDSKTSLTDFVEQARGMLAVNPLLAPQMEQFWKAQDGVLEEAESFSKAWFERRHEAAQSALEAVQNVNGNGADPSAAARTVMEWQQQSLQRMADDMHHWLELCSRCASRMASAEVEAGQEGVEEVAKRAKTTAKTKHSTPV